jgi:hypothetical protein
MVIFGRLTTVWANGTLSPVHSAEVTAHISPQDPPQLLALPAIPAVQLTTQIIETGKYLSHRR